TGGICYQEIHLINNPSLVAIRAEAESFKRRIEIKKEYLQEYQAYWSIIQRRIDEAAQKGGVDQWTLYVGVASPYDKGEVSFSLNYHRWDRRLKITERWHSFIVDLGDPAASIDKSFATLEKQLKLSRKMQEQAHNGRTLDPVTSKA